jgi:membrane-bound ClpP family serine protease
MLEWITVISLILFGLALLVAEIIFVPGTTLVGVLGFVFLIIGIGLSFHYFGSNVGWITAGGAAVASGLVLYFSFKANVWGRFALKSSNQGKVNEGELEGLAPGQEGVALSALRPVGKAEVAGRTYEVKTLGGYVTTGTKIRIIQILSNQIIVEPTT